MYLYFYIYHLLFFLFTIFSFFSFSFPSFHLILSFPSLSLSSSHLSSLLTSSLSSLPSPGGVSDPHVPPCGGGPHPPRPLPLRVSWGHLRLQRCADCTKLLFTALFSSNKPSRQQNQTKQALHPLLTNHTDDRHILSFSPIASNKRCISSSAAQASHLRCAGSGSPHAHRVVLSALRALCVACGDTPSQSLDADFDATIKEDLDMSVQTNALSLFVEKHFTEHPQTMKVIKCINQAAIAPAVIFLRMGISNKIAFRDSRMAVIMKMTFYLSKLSFLH